MSSFDGASLNDLRAMIASADPSGLDTVASKWSAIHEALRQAQEDLLHHTLAATNHWQGAAADAFSARADELHQSLGNGAAYAFNASSGVSCAADSLRTAQAAMPAGALSLEGIAAAQQATAAGVTATQFEDRQRQQAAAVMRRLEEEYVAAGKMIGTPASAVISSDRGTFPDHSSSITLQKPRSTTFQNRAKEDLTNSSAKATFIQPTEGSANFAKGNGSNTWTPPPGEPRGHTFTEPEGKSALRSYCSSSEGTPVDQLANQSTFDTTGKVGISTARMNQTERPKSSAVNQTSSLPGEMRRIPPEEDGFGPAQLPRAPHQLPRDSALHHEPANWKDLSHGGVQNTQQAKGIGGTKPSQVANRDSPASPIEQMSTPPGPLNISARSNERSRSKSQRPKFLTQDASEWIGSCPPANPSVISY